MNKLLRLVIWIFPVAAIALSAHLAQKYYRELGPLITIEFDDAAAIEPNKTKIVYRGIAVGKVEKTELNDDGSKALAIVRMAAKTEGLLRDHTRFVVVQPEVTMEGISGLETLVKGPVIRLEPGKGERAHRFTGVETEHEDRSERNPVIYHLTTSQAESLGPNDPLFFRGTKIGKVVEAKISKDARGVVLDLAVFRPYVRVIRANSVFWRKNAVKADLGLFGSKIEIGSLETMMRGGVNVATPGPAAKVADPGEAFALRDAEPEDWRQWAPALSL